MATFEEVLQARDKMLTRSLERELTMAKHGGIDEICRLRQAPGVKVSWGGRNSTKKGDGEYVSGLAEYVGDPNAFCSTRTEAEDKLKRKGLDFERT